MNRRRKKSYSLWPNRDPLRNCFLLPNEIFRLNLSGGAIAVYAYLRCIEDRETYEANAKYDTIGNAVGMSRNTVMKYVSELTERGFITTKRMASITANGSVQLGSLRYTILPIQNAVDLYNEQLIAKADAIRERSKAQKKLAKMKTKNSLSPRDLSGRPDTVTKIAAVRPAVNPDAYEKNVRVYLRCHSSETPKEQTS